MNEPFVWTVFALVYLGMLLGRLPGLALDRTGVALLGTGVALLGAIALVAGGLLLTSRRTASRANLALVDWQLLLLFIGLFVVHRAVEATGAVERAVHAFAANLIVVDLAARSNLRIGWKTHARVGAPVAIVTLAIGAAWLALVA